LRRTLTGEDVTYEWHFEPGGDGEARRLRVHLSPMRDADGVVTGIAGVAADVTRRVRAEAEAAALRARIVESERAEALGKLVSGVAHELNNPLAAVLNFTEDLLDTEPDPDRRAALEVVRAQALRSRTIVRDLLTFARRGGHRPLSPQEPGPIIESIVRAMRPGLGRGVSLHCEITDGDTSIELDRAGFEQVVTNLVTNAAHSAPRDGHVRLVARRDGAEYRIDVCDDGPGIPSEILPRIFEPFFTTKATGQGVGLGLSVSLGIVQEHHGTLDASNGAEGVGACFTVRLPVSARVPIAPTPPIGIPLVRGHQRTPPPDAPGLLIVDDEEPIRRALRRFFERRGWRVEEAVDGLEGLAKLVAPGAEKRYAAILCDLRMPGLDGPELYQRVRERAPALLGRIVISTGDTSGDKAADFLDSVNAPVLQKPYELSEVATVLDQLRAGNLRGG
jgi:signal transduction histidine kinase/CheY-like chemotaxis protein